MCTRYVYLTILPFIAGFPRGYIYQESESNVTNKIVIWPILRLGDYYQAVNATDRNDEKVATLKELRNFIKFTFLRKTVSPATASAGSNYNLLQLDGLLQSLYLQA